MSNILKGIVNEGISAQDLADVLYNRLTMRYPDIVNRYGHEVVGDIVSDVASFHEGADELGSSDIGIMIRQIIRKLENYNIDEAIDPAQQTVYMQVKGLVDQLDKRGKQKVSDALKKNLGVIAEGGQKPGEDYKDPEEADYDEKYQDMVKRVGQKAKQQQQQKAKGVAEGSEHYDGIEISMEKEDDEIMVKAMMSGGRELGHVLFVIDGEYLAPQDLEVDERYQGQGIAATMYDYVKSKGYKIRRSGQQTDAGAGFWDKHRPEQNVWEAHHSESCPHCGGEMVSEELMNEKKDACYYKVKSRYKVWPSAYASGALVKCRKKGADNWGNGGKKNESVEDLDENLHKWFQEKWVRFGPDGKIRGACARGDDSEGKPKCLPQSKAQNLGKKGRASAAARKRREDPNPERSGKAINVNTKKKSNESVAENKKFTKSNILKGLMG